jgi:predicted O-methyltransferase YrrM
MDLKVQQKLSQLEKTKKEFWNISHEVGTLLNLLIKVGRYRNILEVGTSNGYSAIWFALAAQEIGGHVVSIEYFQHRLDLAKKNLSECDLLGKTTLIHGKALEILKKLNVAIFEEDDDHHFTQSVANSNTPYIPNQGTVFRDINDPFIDFAFIDASKLEYVEYFKLIHPKLKRGGMIVADNIISHDSIVKGYSTLMLSHKEYQTIKLYLGGGLLISVKN